MQFDNHDSRIKYYELMLRGTLSGAAEYPLPEGYRFVLYEKGDRDAWRIVKTLTNHPALHEFNAAGMEEIEIRRG